MVARAGFIVQNAVTAGANLDLAEPDALDFNMLGNQRHGVIGTDPNACRVRSSGSSTISVDPGVVVVDGALVLVSSGQTNLPGPSQAPRFDLITVDAGGAIGAIVGTADPNPIFPDYTDAVTVLAAVMIRPGTSGPQASDITDKRVMLPERYMTAIKDGSLLHNSDPIDLHPNFDIAFDGRMVWDGDGTALERTSTKTLRVSDNLTVVGTLNAHDLALVGDLNVSGDLIASNFRQGTTNPSGTAQPGDLYRNLTDGSVWVYQNGSWVQLSTVPIPAGMTMMGFMTTAPPGWLLVAGQIISKATSGGLWNARPDWRIDSGTMRLPDAQNTYFAWGPPGQKFGNTSPQVQLQVVNLPAHKHLASPTTSAGGSHSHTVQQTPGGQHSHLTIAGGYYGGAHTHDVYDPGHTHPPPPDADAYVTRTIGGGPKRLQNGPWDVGFDPTTGTNVDQYQHGTTGIQVTTTASNHQHQTDAQGTHTHGFSIDPTTATHSHPITENSVGSGTPFDIRPPSMGMYLFVKT